MCGTKVTYPLVRPPTTQSKGQALVPSASDILDSLHLSKSDVLYASPSGLENMLETASASGKSEWKRAAKNLKEAHSGGAPTSYEKADLFTKHGLMVMQVFATTEAGMM
jgi:phenylacetate-coenzyme A ligase PaaK-like adenylate-forming protein